MGILFLKELESAKRNNWRLTIVYGGDASTYFDTSVERHASGHIAEIESGAIVLVLDAKERVTVRIPNIKSLVVYAGDETRSTSRE